MSKYGLINSLKLFIEKGVDINIKTLSILFLNFYSKLSALYFACKNNHVDIVKLLIDNNIIIHSFDDDLKKSPIGISIIKGNQLILDILIQNLPKFDHQYLQGILIPFANEYQKTKMIENL